LPLHLRQNYFFVGIEKVKRKDTPVLVFYCTLEIDPRERNAVSKQGKKKKKGLFGRKKESTPSPRPLTSSGEVKSETEQRQQLPTPEASVDSGFVIISQEDDKTSNQDVHSQESDLLEPSNEDQDQALTPWPSKTELLQDTSEESSTDKSSEKKDQEKENEQSQVQQAEIDHLQKSEPSSELQAKDDPLSVKKDEKQSFQKSDLNQVDQQKEDPESKSSTDIDHPQKKEALEENTDADAKNKPLTSKSSDSQEESREEVAKDIELVNDQDLENQQRENNEQQETQAKSLSNWKENLDQEKELQSKKEELEAQALQYSQQLLANIEKDPQASVQQVLQEIADDKDKDPATRVAEISALRLAAEERYTAARVEYDRAVTLRKLNESHRITIDKQNKEIDELQQQLQVEKKLLSEDRRRANQTHTESRAAREKFLVESTAAEQARITQIELQERARQDVQEADQKRALASQELDEAQIKREQADNLLKQAERKEKQLQEREERISRLESKIDELYDSAEKSRQESLEIQKQIHEVQETVNKTNQRTERHLKFIKQQRQSTNKEHEKARELRLQAEQKLTEADQQAALNASEAVMIEEYEQRRSQELKAALKAMAEAQESEAKVKADFNHFEKERDILEEQLRNLELSKKALNGEVTRLENNAKNYEQQQLEIEALRKQVENHKLESEELNRLRGELERSSAGSNTYQESQQQSASEAVRDLIGQVENVDLQSHPLEAAALQQTLNNLIAVSSGEDVVSTLESSARKLLSELSPQSNNESSPDFQSPGSQSDPDPSQYPQPISEQVADPIQQPQPDNEGVEITPPVEMPANFSDPQQPLDPGAQNPDAQSEDTIFAAAHPVASTDDQLNPETDFDVIAQQAVENASQDDGSDDLESDAFQQL
jgi:hypothetical protein